MSVKQSFQVQTFWDEPIANLVAKAALALKMVSTTGG